NEKLLARTHWISINPSRGNLVASPTLNGFIHTHDQWLVSWNKQASQQQQQPAAQFPTRPRGAIEDAVRVLKLLVVRTSHNPQDGSNRAFSGHQDRSDQEHFGPVPDAFGF